VAVGVFRELPFAYRKGTSFLHRVPALPKLITLLAVSLAAFSSIPGLVISALIVAGFAFSGGIAPHTLLRGSRGLFFLAGFIILGSSLDAGGTGPAFSLPGFFSGLRQGLCILVSFAAAALIFAVTTMGEIRAAMGRNRLSLGLSLMLGFIPRFFEIWENASLAWKARGGRRGPARLRFIIPLCVEKMMEHAGRTAEALEARGLSL
jgi:biotin transport system permease protein